MTGTDEPADFPTPPRRFTDAERREVVVGRAAEGDREALCDMYLEFDPADRAQGIPPVAEEAIREWLDAILLAESFNVVARHGERAVGHATLVPDDTGTYELAIFVLDDFQGARIGTQLVRSLLGWAQNAGVESVWLTVERWNNPAITLYKKVGFETASTEGFELEMGIRL